MATTVLLHQNHSASLWNTVPSQLMQWYLSILIRDDNAMHVFYVLTSGNIFLPFRSSVRAAHTAVSSVLYAVDEGLRGQNVSQLFWMNLIRKYSSRSICCYQQCSNEPLQYH